MDKVNDSAVPDYGFAARIGGVTMTEARERVAQALAAEGFGVLTEIDVRATMKKKLDLDFPPYLILGACNPKLAHRALGGDPYIGLLLPCNVTLWEVDGGVQVTFARPESMFSVVRNEAVRPVADEAEQRLRRVLAALGG